MRMQLPIPVTSEDQVVLAALRALALRGPLHLDDLAELLGYDVYAKAFDRLVEELDELDRVVWLPGDRLCDAVALLARVTLTHRLTAAEVADGIVEASPDFLSFCELAGDSLPLRNGGRASVLIGEDIAYEQLQGPPGWLGEAGAGDLVCLRLADGAVRVEAPPSTAGTALAEAAGALRQAADASLPQEQAITGEDTPTLELVEVLCRAIADHGLSGVCPPLSEVVEAAGLAQRGGLICHDIGRFTDAKAWTVVAVHVAFARVQYGLDQARTDVLEALLSGHRAGAIDEGLVLTARTGFADPDILEAFGAITGADQAAAALAQALLDEGVGGRAAAGARYLLARRAEADGDSLAAERHLEAAVSVDDGLAPVLGELAWYVEDRGDTARALRLARDAGLEPDDEQVLRLRRILAEERAALHAAGRNDPCPCGSGRKHKKCCLARPGVGPLARAGWVAAKAVEFVRHPVHCHFLAALAEARYPEQEGGERMCSALEDPLLLDMALFDLGGFDRFLAQRGPLLPAQERELATSWAGSVRELYRVVRHDRGLVHLQPTDGGPAVTVTVPPDGPTLGPGALVLCRVVPTAAGAILFALGVHITPEMLPELEQAMASGATPAELAALLMVGAPRLYNKEGEPSALCRRDYAVPDEAAAEGAVAQLGLDPDGDRSYAEWVDIDGRPWLRGTVGIAGGKVVIETNSEARMGRLAARVEAALPDATLVAEHRTLARLAIDDWWRFGIPDVPHEPPAEARQALGEFVCQAERRWCNEPVPALGGRTPNEALLTMEGRADLEALFADMDRLPSGEGGFDVNRLRGLLGLD